MIIPQKIYRGRLNPGQEVDVVNADGTVEPLNLRRDLCTISTGPARWGSDGAAARQLSFALICEAVGDHRFAEREARNFCRRFTAHLPGDEPWAISGAALRAICAGL